MSADCRQIVLGAELVASGTASWTYEWDHALIVETADGARLELETDVANRLA